MANLGFHAFPAVFVAPVQREFVASNAANLSSRFALLRASMDTRGHVTDIVALLASDQLPRI